MVASEAGGWGQLLACASTVTRGLCALQVGPASWHSSWRAARWSWGRWWGRCCTWWVGASAVGAGGCTRAGGARGVVQWVVGGAISACALMGCILEACATGGRAAAPPAVHCVTAGGRQGGWLQEGGHPRHRGGGGRGAPLGRAHGLAPASRQHTHMLPFTASSPSNPPAWCPARPQALHVLQARAGSLQAAVEESGSADPQQVKAPPTHCHHMPSMPAH
jgi:hypothetical protein